MSVLFLPPSAGAASVPDASETVSGKIRIATSAEATTGTNDLTAMTPAKVKTVVDAAVVGGVTYKGTFDTSAPVDLSNALQGDLYIISVAGSYQGQTWAVGDHLLINADMGGTLDPAKIDKVDNTDAVTSVAGRTGAVVLSSADISGLATVATSGAYSDLSGTPTLGTAAAEDVGTAAGNVVQLNGSAQLPAVDGSLLTNVSASVAALDDVGDVTITGVSNTQVIKYNSTSGEWENGAVAYADVTGTPTLATVATTGAYSDLTGTPTLGTASAEDVGTSANNVVQLNGSAQLPAVDGSLLTNISASVAALDDVGDVTITSVANNEVIKYNSTSGEWENGAVAYADVTGTPTLATVATTGAYSDLTGTPTLATVATTGAYSDLTGTPTLGTASAEDVGTAAGNVVQLNGSAQLPAVDGSLLTNVGASVAALNDIGDVSAASPNNGDIIQYNSTSGNWETGTQSVPPPTVTSSSPSSNVNLTSPSTYEETYIFSPTVTGISINLVAAATCGTGFRYYIKNTTSNPLTIDPSGSETIDGASTYSLSVRNSAITIITNGTNWFII